MMPARLEEPKNRKTFLVVEHDSADAALIRRVFDALESCNAFVCRNLSEAKAYLQGAGMYADRGQHPFPKAVICDFRVGVDFVAWLRNSVDFRNLPVIILTATASTKNLKAAKECGAIDVLRKPARFEELKSMLTDLAASFP